MNVCAAGVNTLEIFRIPVKGIQILLYEREEFMNASFNTGNGGNVESGMHIR